MEARSNSTNRNSGAFVGAVILIVTGIVALVANLGGGEAIYRAIPVAIGAAFLVVYALTRQYGFLVPGGILSGLGVGVLVSGWMSAADAGPWAAIGLGAGFLSIFVVDVLATRESRRWWPVIPGGILVVSGAGIATNAGDLTRLLQTWSPVLLIAIGILVLLTTVARRPRSGP